MMNELILSITTVIAASLTFFVSNHLKQGPVRSSAVLSLFVALFFYKFPNSVNHVLSENIPAVFIGGSFIGMVSKKLIDRHWKLALASLIFSVIYLNTSAFFKGYGGALGASAGISLLTVLSTPFFNAKNHRLSNGIIQLRKFIFKRNRS